MQGSKLNKSCLISDSLRWPYPVHLVREDRIQIGVIVNRIADFFVSNNIHFNDTKQDIEIQVTYVGFGNALQNMIIESVTKCYRFVRDHQLTGSVR